MSTDEPTAAAVQGLREKSTAFTLLDRQAGNFVTWLAARRRDGKSYATIAIDISDEFGVRVNYTTIRRWAFELGIEQPPRAADESGKGAAG